MGSRRNDGGFSVTKSLVWTLLLAGLVAAGIGIVQLFTELAVLGLIVAACAGLVLLQRRSGASAEAERARII